MFPTMNSSSPPRRRPQGRPVATNHAAIEQASGTSTPRRVW
jgi:hypothetical protein